MTGAHGERSICNRLREAFEPMGTATRGFLQVQVSRLAVNLSGNVVIPPPNLTKRQATTSRSFYRARVPSGQVLRAWAPLAFALSTTGDWAAVSS